MCAQATRLSDLKVKAAKPQEKDYVLSDGDGLQMRVRSNGSKLWNLNYRHPVTKNRINMGLGTFPEVSLAQARKRTVEARELLAHGIDPKEKRDAVQQAKKAATEHTFQNVATAWYELKKDAVTQAYAEDIWRSLTLHVFPDLGTTPISAINAPQVINLLRPLETKGSLETVKRLTQRLNEIMTYGVNSGLIHANPLSGIRSVFKKPKKKNMATNKPRESQDSRGFFFVVPEDGRGPGKHLLPVSWATVFRWRRRIAHCRQSEEHSPVSCCVDAPAEWHREVQAATQA